MKIVVIGAGAMGSIYAGLLSDSGHSVWVIDLWKEHTEAIKSKGLRIEGASGDRVVHDIQVIDSLEESESCDLAIIATKTYGVATAAQMINQHLRPHTLVLTIQNGLGAGERISQYLPADNILLGVAQGFGASVKAPGHVIHTSMSMIRIGSMLSIRDPRVDEVIEIWRQAGFNVSVYNDIHQLIWEKFICNVAYSAPCTVFDKSVKELMADKHAVVISRQCAIEAWEVAVAKGINLTFDDPVEYVTAFGIQVGDASPSMLLDHRVKRRSEIDAINGMVPVVAAEEDLHAPYNEVVSGIVKSRESDWLPGPSAALNQS